MDPFGPGILVGAKAQAGAGSCRVDGGTWPRGSVLWLDLEESWFEPVDGDFCRLALEVYPETELISSFYYLEGLL